MQRHLFLTIAAFISLSQPASVANESHNSEHLAQAAQACKSGERPIIERTDTGYQTGQFAVPLRDESGAVYSAILLSKDDMYELEACRKRLLEARNRELVRTEQERQPTS
jgi:hypothetical protein